jgi:hypothetical protein
MPDGEFDPRSGADLDSPVEERRFKRRVCHPKMLGFSPSGATGPEGRREGRRERGPEGPLFHGARNVRGDREKGLIAPEVVSDGGELSLGETIGLLVI